jgi:MFS family permease
MYTPRLGLLRDHDFRGLFAATTVSQLGFQVTSLALPLVAIIALAATEFQAGLLFALVTAGSLLIGLPAGAWVDRLRRRRVLVAGDLARAALLSSVPVAWWTGTLTLWQLYAVALLYGVCTIFFDVAYQSYLPHLVGRGYLVEANSKLESVRSVSQVAGPGLAGQLIHLLSAPVALLVDALTMALSAVFVVRIRKREEPPQRLAERRLLGEIGEGLRFVMGNRLLRAIAASSATFNLFFMAYLSMLTFFLARDLDLGPGPIGLVFSLGGVGGLFGALIARRFAGWVGQGRAIWLSVALGTPFALLMPLAEPGWRVWLGATGWLVYWVGLVVYNVTQVSFRQGVTPDRLLGRMTATMTFLVWGTLPLGGLLGGVLGAWLGARTTLLIAAVGSMFVFLPGFLSPLRNLRDLPRQPGPDTTAADRTGLPVA